MDLFKIITKEGSQNPQFKALVDQKVFTPAKNLLDEICHDINDKDGNFVEQFQTTGFFPRLWEIFLYKFFKENGIGIIEKHDRPDFYLLKNEIEFFVEACSSNPASNDKFTNEFIEASIKGKDAQAEQDLKDYYTMKIGSILFSKLQKEYWKLGWVKGKPFVLALMPSHNKLANFLPDYKAIEYIYGKYFKASIKEGKIEGTSGLVTEHVYGDKKIPSGFFDQKDTEHISAVIFSNTCDIHKFNRMGQEGKHYDHDIIMLRTGLENNLEPNGLPLSFQYQVSKQERKETWSEGVTILHNPKAIVPLDKSIFKGVRQIWTNKEGALDGEMPNFYPFNSMTGYLVRLSE